ncbi:ABC transporter permease [Aquabacterium sp. J223]|uniref:ABC transporter permease n=1 Tax=Aquabacterium sp. J223 TaxID=2898431 RepID=UPI0021AD6628|nr:ABC transporter permease [Aquabacterium sp. J223]UUX94797.1 ABC transporter permease [Aquabacterium sp. J223]
MLKTAWAFLKRDFLVASSYRTAFLMQTASILLGVPFIFFISRFLGQSDNALLREYNNNYFAFLLIGVALTDYLTVSLTTFNTSIRENQMMGTLEIIMLSPTSVAALVICSSLWGFCFTTLRFCLYLLGGLAFGMDVSSANLLSAMVVLLLSIVSFSSIGILIAAITLVIKRGEGLNVAVSALSVVLGGVVFPTKTLPVWLEQLGWLLPFTHSLQAMRLAMLKGSPLADMQPQLLVLSVFAFVLAPLALWVFRIALQHTKVRGTLATY